MTKKILSAFLLCALLLTLFAGCGAKEVQGLPELSPSSLAAPVPAGSTKKIADALASIDPEQVVFPAIPHCLPMWISSPMPIMPSMTMATSMC